MPAVWHPRLPNHSGHEVGMQSRDCTVCQLWLFLSRRRLSTLPRAPPGYARPISALLGLRSGGRLVDYRGDRSARHLKDWALSLLPKHIKSVHKEAQLVRSRFALPGCLSIQCTATQPAARCDEGLPECAQ